MAPLDETFSLPKSLLSFQKQKRFIKNASSQSSSRQANYQKKFAKTRAKYDKQEKKRNDNPKSIRFTAAILHTKQMFQEEDIPIDWIMIGVQLNCKQISLTMGNNCTVIVP